MVLALHACDTATDDALARAVELGRPAGAGRALLPPRHRRPAAAARPTPAPYAMLTRHGILRERFADTLTDALRASLLRLAGLPRRRRCSSSSSKHTPRNTLLRARAHRRAGHRRRASAQEYDDLVATWGVRPRLARAARGDDRA